MGPAAVVSQVADRQVAYALPRGDRATLLEFVKRLHRPMIRRARCYTSNDAVAEEVAQDAWVTLLGRLRQWEGRGSLRSWLYGIVANQARFRAVRESRTVPFSS